MPAGDGDPIGALVSAIRDCRVVRLAYRRQRDGITTLHSVAPVDIRSGETEWLKARTYLWAYCYEESRLERHLLERVVSVTVSEEAFVPGDILAKWPDGWLIPEVWTVPRGDDRDWTSRS